jgi:D-sedoheptulose 7-phosphate isomerase
MLEQRIQQHFFEAADLQYQTAETLARPIGDAAQTLVTALAAGGKLLWAGCGLTLPLAAYAASIFVGRFERDRPSLAALALPTEPPAAQQLRALGQPGDVVLLLDAGGDTDRLRTVLDAARGSELTVVVLAAAGSALLAALGETDVAIAVPHERPVRVLEALLLALHALADAVDLQLMGEQDPA